MADIRQTKCADPRNKKIGILGMLSNDDLWIAREIKSDYDWWISWSPAVRVSDKGSWSGS